MPPKNIGSLEDPPVRGHAVRLTEASVREICLLSDELLTREQTREVISAARRAACEIVDSPRHRSSWWRRLLYRCGLMTVTTCVAVIVDSTMEWAGKDSAEHLRSLRRRISELDPVLLAAHGRLREDSRALCREISRILGDAPG